MDPAARAPDPRAALSVPEIARLRAFSDRMPLVPADYLPGYGPRFEATFTLGQCKRLRFQRWCYEKGRLLP